MRLLIFGLEHVFVDVSCESLEQVFTEVGGALEHFGEGEGRMLSNSENIVTQVSYPDAAKLLILWLRFFWEGCNERATGNTCSISDRPTLILETVNECFE